MVYYSPYKQIWRAFKRAIRVFISSLFSKRLLLMIIVALAIILLHLNVHAESIYQDGYAYRNIKFNGYDNDTNLYSWDYRIYLNDGIHEGTISITQEMYNKNHWILYYTSNNGFYFLFFNSDDSLYIHKKTNVDYLYFSNYSNSIQVKNFGLYKDNKTGTFTYIASQNYNNDWKGDMNHIQPNSIIATKDLSISYYDNYQYLGSSSDLSDNRVFITPNLRYYTGTGFRLYLNEFEPNSNIGEEDWLYYYEDNVRLFFSVYDINNQTYSTQLTELQLQDYDDDGNLYVDIPFSDLTYMNVLDGNYLLFFATYLTNVKTMNNSSYGFTTRYDTLDYWRYTYYADSGAGILRAVYEDGTEKPNQDNTSTDDPSQEDTTLQAITELNNTINNQTTIIQEQTNTINDMSDFMQDDSFSSDSITNNMPNNDEFQDVTESGFDNIFTTLRNAFTSDNYQDVEFIVPFSNGQKITLPSNLTENIIPTAIKTLIQMVYWYFISRFIIKDIAGYIEKAKSGDVFNSSDTNIKTDML